MRDALDQRLLNDFQRDFPLDEALDNLDRDREFLTRGGVFTNDIATCTMVRMRSIKNMMVL